MTRQAWSVAVRIDFSLDGATRIDTMIHSHDRKRMPPRERTKMTLKNLLDRIPLFWTLQTLGFCGYAIDRWIQGPQWFFPVNLGYIVMAFALTLCLRPIYHRVWEKSPPVWKIGLIVFFCSILAAYLWLLISMRIFRSLGWMNFTIQSPHEYLVGTLEGTLTHHKPFLFLSWSALYFGIKYWQQSQQEQQETLRAAALAKEAELQMLRYQLNPHFLFNSLNSASALIHENPARAEKMIGELSEFLRHSLANGKAGDAPLSDELEAARSYLDIEKIRFEDKLIVGFDVEPKAGEFRVPSILIHPLVENAVKYRMQTSPMPLRVEISAQAADGALRLEVVNTGKWVEDSTNGRGANIGIENALDYLLKPVTQERLTRAVERLSHSQTPDESPNRRLEHDDFLFLTIDQNSRFLRVREIKYISAADVYSEIITSDEQKTLVLKPLSEWEERLPEKYFARIHRSTIINIEFVERVEKWFNYSFQVHLRGVKEPLTMSRRYAAKLKDKLS